MSGFADFRAWSLARVTRGGRDDAPKEEGGDHCHSSSAISPVFQSSTIRSLSSSKVPHCHCGCHSVSQGMTLCGQMENAIFREADDDDNNRANTCWGYATPRHAVAPPYSSSRIRCQLGDGRSGGEVRVVGGLQDVGGEIDHFGGNEEEDGSTVLS